MPAPGEARQTGTVASTERLLRPHGNGAQGDVHEHERGTRQLDGLSPRQQANV